MVTSASKLDCPATTWTLYKNVQDDATGLYNIGNQENEVEFTLKRSIMYECFSEYDVRFKTSWSADARGTHDHNDDERFVGGITVSCNKQSARDDHIRVTMEINKETRNWIIIGQKWSTWANNKLLSKFFYVKKNCDKFYWTNWIATSTCEASSHIIRKRTCMDCEGDALEQEYCNATGQAVDENDCNHYWGNWFEGPCITTGCNTVGERIRTRQCLYGDAHKATKVQLCFNGNESAIMKQECINNTIPDKCEPQTSPGTGNAGNTGFYVGIGVAVALIVILCILLVFVRSRRLKATDFLSDNSAKLNFSSFCYGFANFAVKADKQSDGVLQSAEVSEQNSVDAHPFANPIASANDQDFKDLKQAKQDKQKNELVENPVAYDFAEIDGFDAQTFEQSLDQDVYEIATPDVSNTYEIATQPDPNIYELENHPMQNAEPNLPAAQSIKGEPEQSNTYSGLLSSSDADENTYSRLEH